jgi:hypothetical protein
MTHIPLELRQPPFVTEHGTLVPAPRLLVRADFLSPLGQRIRYRTIVDSGSPYSFVPRRLASQIQWSSLGRQLIRGGQSRAVAWFGVPCEMGALEVELVNPSSLIRTRPLRVVAKVAIKPALGFLEDSAVLGLNFVLDNHVWQELDATGPSFAGQLLVS